jgi:hypothetical protein
LHRFVCGMFPANEFGTKMGARPGR